MTLSFCSFFTKYIFFLFFIGVSKRRVPTSPPRFDGNRPRMYYKYPPPSLITQVRPDPLGIGGKTPSQRKAKSPLFSNFMTEPVKTWMLVVVRVILLLIQNKKHVQALFLLHYIHSHAHISHLRNPSNKCKPVCFCIII